MRSFEFPVDCTGMTFARWKVLHRIIPYAPKQHIYFCRCECGTQKEVRRNSLVTGSSLSCGCLRDEVAKKLKTTHGYKGTKIYQTWGGMIQRCTNPKAPYYECYGGRGITVCDRWRDSFEDFLADMGEKPKGLTIDRIDVDKGYSPENCRWADLETQAKNTTRSRMFTRDGVTKHLFDWIEESDIAYKTVEKRLRNGWDIDSALTVPVGTYMGGRRRSKTASTV